MSKIQCLTPDLKQTEGRETASPRKLHPTLLKFNDSKDEKPSLAKLIRSPYKETMKINNREEDDHP